jgi:hypothetical protein
VFWLGDVKWCAGGRYSERNCVKVEDKNVILRKSFDFLDV